MILKMTTLNPFPNKRYLVFCFRQNKPENIGKIIPTPNKSPITPPGGAFHLKLGKKILN